jgi:hypothetical protein
VRTFLCYDGPVQRSWRVGFVVLAACSKTANPEAVPASPDGWQCFVLDPADTNPEHQLITHTRQRVVGGGIEIESVMFTGKGGGANRTRFVPVGDHLEDARGGGAITARLLTPDGSHWTLAFRPEKGSGAMNQPFDEDSLIDGGALTVTSMVGGGKTVIRYLAASCDVVVAELAKYP